MTHTHDRKAMELAAERGCDDGRSHRILKLAEEIHRELGEAHQRREDMTKMAVRVILRGWNGTISAPKAEAAIARLIAATTKTRGEQ